MERKERFGYRTVDKYYRNETTYLSSLRHLECDAQNCGVFGAGVQRYQDNDPQNVRDEHRFREPSCYWLSKSVVTSDFHRGVRS